MRKGTKHLYAGFRLTALDISTIVENYKKNIKTFKKNEVIMHTSCREDLLGVVIRGTAYLVGENEAAQRGIIECFETGDLFSRKMLLNLAGNIFYVISKYPCEIALINYNQLADCCTENHPDSTNILDDKCISNCLISKFPDFFFHTCFASFKNIILYFKFNNSV